MTPTDADRADHIDAYAEAVSCLAGLCLESEAVDGPDAVPGVLLAAFHAARCEYDDDPAGLAMAALDLVRLALADCDHEDADLDAAEDALVRFVGGP